MSAHSPGCSVRTAGQSHSLQDSRTPVRTLAVEISCWLRSAKILNLSKPEEEERAWHMADSSEERGQRRPHVYWRSLNLARTRLSSFRQRHRRNSPGLDGAPSGRVSTIARPVRGARGRVGRFDAVWRPRDSPDRARVCGRVGPRRRGTPGWPEALGSGTPWRRRSPKAWPEGGALVQAGANSFRRRGQRCATCLA
jgi:hypothetical protein